MKKLLLAFAAVCCIALISSFSFPPVLEDEPSDYTYYHLMESPVCDVPVAAYNCASRAPMDILICPGSGVTCNVKVTFLGVVVTMHSEKGRGRYDVEISGSAQ